ncbi:glutathione ABC transporter substrate-binding protein [Erysipelothrix sp. HDW6C]|uniref:glutathione ABC transporter substrate-binding protein n=1 Tax=Erysipelothrix sp. HDW6C TaxID=2714930 RepID=UPI00140A08E4|nr:glutathione ABC transporter substrate-binding protein [Erysipelothrix sp. HDW6C]QIK69834.1 glutathione ABC transporter substrate-binding protein [Erysipelothrix sp. HDW6C]
MRFRKSKLVLVLVTLGVFLTACSTGGGGTGGKDTLTVASSADAVTFDIQNTNDQATTRVARQMYEPLIQQNDALELVPGLAESWTALDDTTYEFKLKKDVKFHNGEPFTAKDVEYTMKRAAESEQIGHIVGELDVSKIKVVDDYTIQLGTKEPFGPFLTHLAHPATAILNEKAVTEGGEDYGTNPVGTGPYKFASWIAGSEINVERFEDYHGTPGATEKIKFKVIKENSVRLISLETGEIDIAYDIAPSDIAKVEENKDLTMLKDPNLSTGYIGFNVQSDTPIKDVKVRQAINYAIDVDAILSTVYQGVGSKANGPLNHLVFGADKNPLGYEYDVEKAKALLTEAGYPTGGFTLKLYVGDNNAQRIAIAEIVKEELSKLGITVEITQLEWATYLDATGKGEHDLFILGWTTITTDADYGLYPLFHSSEFGKAGNRSFYKNERVDELLDKGKSTVNPDERLAIYKEAQELISVDAPWIFVNDGENDTAISNKVKGFAHHPSGSHFLSGVSVED